MHTRSRWSRPLSLLAAVAVTACSDTSTSPPLSFDEVPIAEEAETLKGDDNTSGGTCPDGYFLEEIEVGLKYDVNRNGYYCYDGFSHAVDDILTAEGPDTEFAGGHGNFLAAGKKEEQNISFSFHGRQNKTMVVKGEFELHDFANNLRIHGEVNCLVVEKNRAIMSGLITQSTDAKLPVGSSVLWHTFDNGEGINEPVDLISRPTLVKSPKEGCKGKLALDKLFLIEAGNIQVLN